MCYGCVKQNFNIISVENTVAMAVNLTGVDLNLYFSINTAANLGLFFTVVLPTLILCVFLVAAFILAKEIRLEMCVMIINVLAAEIAYWVGFSVMFAGFPSRARVPGNGDYTCSAVISAFIVGSITKFTSIALYAVNVYILIRLGPKN